MQWRWGDTSGGSGRKQTAVMLHGRWERSLSEQLRQELKRGNIVWIVLVLWVLQ
jgi:hypothetical protein